jgi:hypothetical protein
MNKIYAINHFNFIDKIVIKKRKEIAQIINLNIKSFNIESAIDIGTTSDIENKSSNFIIKNLNIKQTKITSLTDQKINDVFFYKKIKKSITDDYTNEEILSIKSDLVVSNATIEHVGSYKNQLKMIENVINLAKKIFIITTPNRYHFLDFHTKLPFLHWLPKKVHRYILSLLGINFFSKEENLNLLSSKELDNMMQDINFKNYKIIKINFLGLCSNLILIGYIK